MSDFLGAFDAQAGLLSLIVRVTSVLFAAWVLQSLLRMGNPQWRILSWRLAYVGLIIVTVSSLWSPHFTLALLPSTASSTIDAEASAPPRLNDQTISDSVASSPQQAVFTDPASARELGSVFDSMDADRFDSPELRSEPTSQAGVAYMTPQDSSHSTGTGDAVSNPLLLWVSLVWAAGCAWCFVRLHIGSRRLAMICRESNSLPGWIAQDLFNVLPSAAVQSCVILKCTPAIGTPCSSGVFRQYILLPISLCTMERREELQAALAHELAHIRGNDLRWNFLMHVVDACLWFHPLVWKARLAHVDACDERCDAEAWNMLPSPKQYARALARIALAASDELSATALTMARGSSIGKRIKRIESESSAAKLSGWKSIAVAGVATASFVLIALVGVVRTSAANNDNLSVDQYDDLLPPGAVARLGSIRYRHPGWYKQIAFLPSSNQFVIGTSDNSVAYWDALTGIKTHEIFLGGDRLKAFCLSPDGRSVATLSQSGEQVQDRIYQMRLTTWDAVSHEELGRFEWRDDISSSAVSVALSPDETTVAVGTRHGAIRLWDLESGEETKMFPALRGEVDSVAFSPDGSVLAIAGRHGVALWRVGADDQPRPLDGLPRGGQVVRFSPNGTILAVGSDDDAAARLYEVKSRKLVKLLRGESARYYREGLCFSSDGEQLFIPANQSKSVGLFDVSSGEFLRSLDAQPIEPRGVAISSDGQFVASIGSETAIVVWNLKSGERISDRAVGHAEPPYDVAFSKDDKHVVSASPDGTVRIWDASDGRQVRVIDNKRWVAGMAVSPNDEWIATCGLDDTVRLWECDSGTEKYRFPGHGRQGGNGSTEVTFASDGKRFYSFGLDLYLRSYDVASGRVLAEFAIRPSDIPIEETEEGELRLAGENAFGGGIEWLASRLGSALFSRDGTRLFLSDRNAGHIYVFDTDNGQEIAKLSLDSGVRASAVTPDGKSLVTVERIPKQSVLLGEQPGDEFSLRLRDLGSSEVLSQTPLEGSFGNSLAISQSGKFVALSQSPKIVVPMSEKWIDIYDLSNMKLTARIGYSPYRVSCLAFSHDETRLVASYGDSTLMVWDLSELSQAEQPE